MDRPSIDFEYCTTASGLRVICRRIQWPVEHFGVIVRAGSADDFTGCEGVAHFVEHTLFKGTARRKASAVNNRMEEVGGELNAFTTKETTVVYTAFPPGYASRAIDLVGDLVSNPAFPEKETLRERRIVDEEISSYLDAPADRVFDEFDDLIFAGSPLGHNILGTHESLNRLTPDDCHRFVDSFYTPSRMVVFYSGAKPIDSIAAEVERRFSLRSDSHFPDLMTVPTVDRFEKVSTGDDNYQANVVEGCRLPIIYGDSTAAISLLNNILGGPTMNSRLNMSMRERNGLVYTVESSLSIYSATSLMTVYYGCSEEDRHRCHRILAREIDCLASNHLSETALAKAKRQFCGQLTTSAAAADNIITGAARRTLYCGRALTFEEMYQQIEAVTADQLTTLAQSLTEMSSLTLL